jgi:hypothetical protein
MRGLGSDEFVASFPVSSLVGGDSYYSPNPDTVDPYSLPTDIPLLNTQAPAANDATVSVQQLQQEQAQGKFANPQVPLQYDLSAQQKIFEVQQGDMAFNVPLLNAETNAVKTAGMWNGGGGVMPTVAAAPATNVPSAGPSLVVSPSAPSSALLGPPAPGVTATSWWQQPVIPGVSNFTWGWAIAIAAVLWILKEMD